MAVVSSASNLLAQLDEEDEALRLSALQSLNNVVHEFWFQIASSIASVEAFYEDESFTHRALAALVASKVNIDLLASLLLLFDSHGFWIMIDVKVAGIGRDCRTVWATMPCVVHSLRNFLACRSSSTLENLMSP